MSNTDLIYPPDLVRRQADIERKKAIANALLQRSMQQPDPMRTAGRYVIPFQAGEGLSQLGNAITGSILAGKASNAEASMGAQQKAYRDALLGRAVAGDKEAAAQIAPEKAAETAFKPTPEPKQPDADIQGYQLWEKQGGKGGFAGYMRFKAGLGPEATARANGTLGADGLPSGNDDDIAAKIASGDLPPLSGFALARPRGMAIMAKVVKLNPNYDATAYGAKQKAQKDFSTGQQGNALRSIGVANVHLGQLDGLVDALGNGDVKAFNRVAQTYAEQTGNPAPTNFDAIKDVVGAEVMKAIVAGGGGVTERQELRGLLDNAKSPQQLRGVIRQYRDLMSAQREGLKGQYEASGLKDFDTRFSSSQQPPTSQAPDISKTIGGKTYVKRGGKWYEGSN